MEQEVWLPIKYGSGKKEISNYGNVRNAITKQVLKSYISKQNGYKHISFHISKEIGRKTFKVHRLVAEHFIPNPENRKTVNHKDFDKLNNNVSNLEWHTLNENIAHYFREKFNHIISDDIVKFIRENIGIITPNNLAKKFNLPVGYIYGVANGIHCPRVHSELIREKRPSMPKPVQKLGKDGCLIKSYDSISRAAKDNNCKISHIQRVLSGERSSFGGFIYKSDGYPQAESNKKGIERLIKWKEKQKELKNNSLSPL